MNPWFGRAVLRLAVWGVATVALTAGAFAQETPQVAEKSTYEISYRAFERGVATGPARAQRICQPGARWLRVHFDALHLAGKDSLVVEGAAGDTFVLQGDARNGRSFYTRGFAGACVTLRPRFRELSSRFEVDRIQVGTEALTAATSIVAAVGDICGTDCNLTAPLITSMSPAVLLALGDLAYENGSTTDFNTLYQPYYGPFKPYTKPSPGNHEYQTANASGYFDYFNGAGVFTGPAGDRDKGYYSFDQGDWHMVSLNSNISMTATSAQVTWLKADLAANTKPCTLAYWHHPRFTRANYDDHASVQELYKALQDAQADVILQGHDHNYQRYKKMTASGTIDAVNGLRSWVVGTGGRGFYATRSDTRRDAQQDNTYGVLKLTLTATGYSWEFLSESGGTYTDSGSDTCKKAVQTPDFGISVAPAALTVVQGGPGQTATVTLSSLNGFSASTGLSVTGLPAGVTASFSPVSVTPAAGGSATSTLTLTASGTATVGTAALTVTGTSGALSHSTPLSLTVNPAGGGGNQVLTSSAAPAAAIPDNNTTGVTSTINVAASQTITSVSVTVGITHTYQGDLEVALIGPDNTTVLLHNKTGGTTDNINTTYNITTRSNQALTAFNGKSTSGAWKLRVRDLGAKDTGTLNTWKITFNGYSTATVNTAIPDNNTTGITSTINVPAGGTLASLSVRVDITHTYKGDLEVSLIGPDNTTVLLHNKTGGTTDNVKTVYSDLTVPAQALSAFNGKAINGAWKLKVRDLASTDTGTLNFWEIDFRTN